jgi:hypothetical protein
MTCGYALAFTKTADRSFSEDRRQMAEGEKLKNFFFLRFPWLRAKP